MSEHPEGTDTSVPWDADHRPLAAMAMVRDVILTKGLSFEETFVPEEPVIGRTIGRKYVLTVGGFFGRQKGAMNLTWEREENRASGGNWSLDYVWKFQGGQYSIEAEGGRQERAEVATRLGGEALMTSMTGSKALYVTLDGDGRPGLPEIEGGEVHVMRDPDPDPEICVIQDLEKEIETGDIVGMVHVVNGIFTMSVDKEGGRAIANALAMARWREGVDATLLDRYVGYQKALAHLRAEEDYRNTVKERLDAELAAEGVEGRAESDYVRVGKGVWTHAQSRVESARADVTQARRAWLNEMEQKQRYEVHALTVDIGHVQHKIEGEDFDRLPEDALDSHP